MNLHLNRRLEVLAKEIAAAKAPKIDEAANRIFAEAGRSGYCKKAADWKIKGAATALSSESAQTNDPMATTPTAAPPSTPASAEPVFKPGDKFRVKDDFADYFRINEFIVIRADELSVWAVDPNEASKRPGMFHIYNIEPIDPPQSPKEEKPGEWIDCGPNMPDIPGGAYQLRHKSSFGFGEPWTPKHEWPLLKNVCGTTCKHYQYRILPSTNPNGM